MRDLFGLAWLRFMMSVADAHGLEGCYSCCIAMDGDINIWRPTHPEPQQTLTKPNQQTPELRPFSEP